MPELCWQGILPEKRRASIGNYSTFVNGEILISIERADLRLNMIRNVGAVGGTTLISRVTGLVRDIAFAQFLEAAPRRRLFCGISIPNFFRRIFGEGALSVAFVPVYSEYEASYPAAEARAFLDLMAGRLSVVLLSVTALGVAASPVLVGLMAPGFLDDPIRYDSTVSTLRWTFPYLFFISLVAMAAGILNTHDRFGAAAATPILLNLSLITTVWLFVPDSENGAVTLGIGVLIAGVAQARVSVSVPDKGAKNTAATVRAHPRRSGGCRRGGAGLETDGPCDLWSFDCTDKFVGKHHFASFLVTGSVSWLYYSDRLMEFPLGVFGVALATVILPRSRVRWPSVAKRVIERRLTGPCVLYF